MLQRRSVLRRSRSSMCRPRLSARLRPARPILRRSLDGLQFNRSRRSRRRERHRGQMERRCPRNPMEDPGSCHNSHMARLNPRPNINMEPSKCHRHRPHTEYFRRRSKTHMACLGRLREPVMDNQALTLRQEHGLSSRLAQAGRRQISQRRRMPRRRQIGRRSHLPSNHRPGRQRLLRRSHISSR